MGGEVESLAGRKLVLAIRAESIVVERAAGFGLIQAMVLGVEPLGSHNLLTVKIGKDTLKVSIAPDFIPALDSVTWLRITPERIRWMDREPKRTIPTGAHPPGTTVIALRSPRQAQPLRCRSELER